MKSMNREEFMKNSTVALDSIYDIFENLPNVELGALNPSETALIIVDMVNGFAKEGMLQSPRNKALILPITKLQKRCLELGIKVIAFADSHPKHSPEFEAYPAHCLIGSDESKVVGEIKKIGGYVLIEKNSTNGFLEPQFQEWIEENSQIKTFVIVGNCTDICVLQLTTTIKADFNRRNESSRVIVPVDAVDTFGGGSHDGDLMGVMALFMMLGNKIEVVQTIV